ncbi:NADPH-dependent 2,4-dienoyl-CoA reductase [Brachybacterium kimchii]|uniref:NADPH-dependent 2,4-dienoyl-CoA reductase n=1 Tax=Brachybacterium kimchii TaxID=2942909 RepID=A0ABY4N459_9MICO|nr:NADPH-dependent 2,4-dienoyl-CoA reductase [Brachybacterium kimchii]UQN29361.1 NADPH-dependent 2,4-dienoyl-CoA reductase [Brachybacterium kimchii]
MPELAQGSFPHLLSPLDLGPFTVPNRLVMGSMHVGLEDEEADAPKLAAHLAERARGGVGLIVTGGYSPNLSGRLTPHGAQIRPRRMDTHRLVTRDVHEAGGRIVLQLLHAGRYSFHPLAAAPSAGKSPITPFRARALTRAGVRRTIADFARAARAGVEAGYDGVEIMGSEGYLLNQFLAPRTNRRRDRFGRTAEDRRAVPLAVATAVREAIGPRALLTYRISLLDLVPEGQDWEETLALAHALEEIGVDVLSTGIGWHEARVPTIATSVPSGAFVEVSRRLRTSVDVPVVASNRLHDPRLAESVIADGSADLVSMARQLLADPQLPAKLASGREREVVSCISCNQACLDKVFSGERASCLVNPRAARETELTLLPAPVPRRRQVAVVGGGPAGLEAAVAAGERGHVVTLFEASSQLGGQFLFASRIPGKEAYAEALRSWQSRLAAEGVDVKLETRPDAEALRGFDDVIIATGVRPRVLDLPGFATAEGPAARDGADGTSTNEAGAEGPQVLSYAQLLSMPRHEALAAVGERVAIIGAGGIGVDVAEFLTAPEPSLTEDPPAWRERWGMADPAAFRGGLAPSAASTPTTPSAGLAPSALAVADPPQAEATSSVVADPHAAPARPREVHLLQRKSSKIGKGLGRTTGWVHRAELRHAGIIEHRGVAYRSVDAFGLHVTEGQPEGRPEEQDAESRERVIAVDTVVICAGQVSERTLADELLALQGEDAPRVHVIGGADVAAELDAERAIRQAVETAAAL